MLISQNSLLNSSVGFIPDYKKAAIRKKDVQNKYNALKLPALEDSIVNINTLIIEEKDPIKKQKLDKLIDSLIHLQKIIHADLYSQIDQFLLKPNLEEYVYSSAAYQIAGKTTVLLHDLKLDNIDEQKNNLDKISQYVKDCHHIDNKFKNFSKAISTVAIAAINVVLTPLFVACAGILALPLLCTSLGIIDPQTKIGKVGGAITGLLLSPIAYAAALIASPFFGISKGIESGREWNKLSPAQPLAHCLLFKSSKVSEAANKVTESAKALFAPKPGIRSN